MTRQTARTTEIPAEIPTEIPTEIETEIETTEQTQTGTVLPFPRKTPSKAARKPRKAPRTFGTLRQLPSGRWQASYLGADGRRHTAPQTYKVKGDAQAWLTVNEAAMAQATWKAPQAAEAFGEYARNWIDTRRSKSGAPLKPRTRIEYRRMLDKVLVPTFGRSTMGQITAAQVKRWYASLSDTPTQQVRAYQLLHAICATWVRDTDTGSNPCRIVGGGEVDVASVREIVPPTPAEVEAMAAAVPSRLALLVRLGCWTGLRFGELAELQRRDVDLDSASGLGVLRISRAVSYPAGEGPTIGSTKSRHGQREIAIPPHLLADVEAHLSEHAGPGPTGYLFPAASDGGPLRYSSTRKHFLRAAAAIGRPDLTLHQLRHTANSLAELAGATETERLRMLGQGSMAINRRYSHVMDGRPATVAARMSALREELSRAT